MLHPPRPDDPALLSARERAALRAIAEAALPAGRVFPAAGPEVTARVEAFFARAPVAVATAYRAALAALDAAAVVRRRSGLAALSPADRLALLEAWQRGDVARRLAVRLVTAPLKAAHFDNPAFFRAIGCVYEFDPPAAIDRPRYVVERAHDAAALDDDVDLDCDVAVVGTGAGGAVVARELAERGVAVILLEEGRYFDRRDFTGRALPLQKRLYRNMGATVAVGNTVIPIPIGKTVGGTTTINAGTCYRVPDRVLRKWRDDFGVALPRDELDRCFERVEQVLGVAVADARYLGGVARVIARGCDRLGFRHTPLRRNAPDCDGKGVCCFGCPTDAKRSTNISYVPLALRAGAELLYGARVDRIVTRGGRAVGVEARAGARRIRVRARAVVVACGALMTPVLLLENGLANASGMLGRNLSIHPAAAAIGEFDEDISGFNAIPQGYAIEEFHDEGLLFEGGSTPLDVAAAAIPLNGPRLVDIAERFDRMAMFGFLIEDSSRGRVRAWRGQPVITYVLNRRDVNQLRRGLSILARVFFAAGARSVIAPVHGFEELRGERDLARLATARLRARDFELSAYHPLGTARMGPDPRRAVVGLDFQAHDVPGLYVVDGSVMPSSLAVNPQVTIMALATLAADRIARAVE
ncbi:MAG: GMC oxidoreductase [Deltaproteobacteria bacterium]|nr:MAG: GMC oxidoreductase [Deltaproteobacteria bacterium]